MTDTQRTDELINPTVASAPPAAPPQDRLQLAPQDELAAVVGVGVAAANDALQSSFARVQEVIRRFTYHPPKGDQAARYKLLRDEARVLALKILSFVPPGREQAQALSDLEDCVMHANKGIAIGECAPENPGVRLFGSAVKVAPPKSPSVESPA